MADGLCQEDIRLEISNLYGHLNDLVYLRTQKVLDLLVESSSNRKEQAWRLHRMLLDAIEELNPGPDVEPFSREWRRYQLMLLRYVDGLNSKQVAQEIAISHRQYYRERDEALDIVSKILWQQYLARTASQAQLPEPDEGFTPPDRMALLRLETARIAQASRYVRVDQVVRKALPLLQDTFRQQQLDIRQNWPAGLPSILINEELLRQLLLAVLGHLTVNASQTTVLIAAQPQQSHIDLTVTLEPPNAFPTDWDAGDRLSPLQEMATLSQASVSPIQTPPGMVGFKIRLPAAKEQTVLVVDDNQDILELFHGILTTHGYRVLTATSGSQAIELAVQTQPYAITLDLMIPGQDGWDILQSLLNNPRTCDIPVIICSVLRQKQLALTLGATAFLAKPVTENELISTLAMLADTNTGTQDTN